LQGWILNQYIQENKQNIIKINVATYLFPILISLKNPENFAALFCWGLSSISLKVEVKYTHSSGFNQLITAARILDGLKNRFSSASDKYVSVVIIADFG